MNKEIEISPRQIASAITNLLNEKEKLQQENKELHNKIDKAIEYIEKFSDPSIGAIKKILKDSDVDECE